MVVLSFTSVLTHAASIFEPLSCVKPSEANERRDPKAYLGKIMKKNQKRGTPQVRLQNLS